MIEQKTAQPENEDERIYFLDILIILVKHKYLLLSIVLICFCIGLAISLLLPPIYTAKTKILPPQSNQSSSMSALVGQLGDISGMASGLTGLKDPNALYVGMLQSQTVADDLINRFKLKDRYKVKFTEDASKIIHQSTTIENGKDGMVTIAFSDKNPAFAAQIANAYVDELKRLSGNLAVTEAARRRLFFQKQLEIAKQQLSDAEERLKNVQEKSGILTLDSQVQTSVAGLAQLKATLASKEIELHSMKTFATQENPEFQRLNSEVAGLKDQLRQLQAKSEDGILATQKIPEAGLEYVRAVRDQKFAETIYELMMKQYEMAKIDESKDSSMIQQLDRAVPPERKSKPSRFLIVLISLMTGIFLSFLTIFVKETLIRINEDPIGRYKLTALVTLLKST